jgi:hypothetical protein
MTHHDYKQDYKTKVYFATAYSYAVVPGTPRWKCWYKIPFAKFMQWLRFRRVTKATAHFMLKGYNMFSPITHSHPIPKYIPKRLDTHTMWLGIDFQWIDVCDELWVFMQGGWKDSHGVEKEIEYANEIGKPVRYVNTNYEFIPEDALM